MAICPLCHSEPVTDVTGVGIRIFVQRRTDCRVASLLAMTSGAGSAVPPPPHQRAALSFRASD